MIYNVWGRTFDWMIHLHEKNPLGIYSVCFVYLLIFIERVWTIRFHTHRINPVIELSFGVTKNEDDSTHTVYSGHSIQYV